MKLKNSIFISIIAFIAIYLLSAFIAWEMNPANWPLDGRFFFVLLATIFSIVIGILYYNLKPSTNEKPS